MKPHMVLLLFPGAIVANQVQRPLWDRLSSGAGTGIEAMDNILKSAGTKFTEFLGSQDAQQQAQKFLTHHANNLNEALQEAARIDLTDFSDNGIWKKQLAWLNEIAGKNYKAAVVWAQDKDWMEGVAWLKGMADVAQAQAQMTTNRLRLDEKKIKALLDDAVAWAKEHPGTIIVVGVAFLVILAPGLVTGPVLAVVGFGGEGVGAGTVASSIQASIGNVLSPSMFSTLQSAAMGGYGVAVVNGVVQTLSTGASAAVLWNAISDDQDKFISGASKL